MAQSPTTRQANYLARHMVELTRGPFLGVRDRDVGLYRGGPSSLRSPDSSMSPRGPSPYVGQVVPRVIAKTYMEEKRHKSGVRGANLYGGGPGEGVDGNFDACYCDALSALDMPGEPMGGGGEGPPMEDPPEEGEEPPLGDGAVPE